MAIESLGVGGVVRIVLGHLPTERVVVALLGQVANP